MASLDLRPVSSASTFVFRQAEKFRNVAEWDKLAKWVINNKLLSHNVRWLIQVPRLYNVYKQAGQVQSFEDIVKSESTVEAGEGFR